MKKIFLCLLVSLLSFNVQSQYLNWAISYGGTAYDESHCVIVDDLGNVFVAGRFEGMVDFDPGINTFNLTSNGDRDFYIQKLDATGSFIWAISLGGALRDDAYSITSDNLGNVYVTGRFEGTVDFDPGAAIFNLTSNGNRDIYVLKLDASGNFLWVRSMGELSNDRGYSITSDASGNVYLTGYFDGTVDFDPGVTIFNLTSNGSDDVFIQKLDASGNFIWAKSIGGTSYDEGWVITTDDSGSLYITGYFEGTVDFDPGLNTFNLSSNGNLDAFILKLDLSGNFLWAQSIGGSSFDSGHSIHTDVSGNVYVSGYFEGTVDFDPSANTFNVTSNGQSDVFILKLNSGGDFIWAKSAGSTMNDIGYSIVADASGNIYVTGYFEGTVDFDPSANTFNLTSIGQSDIFIQKLDSSGNFIWAKSIGGTLGDQAFSITADASGSIYVTGYFEGTVDFDPNTNVFNLTSNGQTDIFVLKLSSSPVGIDNLNFSDSPFLFPNPFQNLVTINLGYMKNVTVSVFNTTGQLIYHRENITGETHQFELNTSTGVYFVELTSEFNKSYYKLIKK